MADFIKVKRPTIDSNRIQKEGDGRFSLEGSRRTWTSSEKTTRTPLLDYSSSGTPLYCLNCDIEMLHLLTGRLQGCYLCGRCGMTIQPHEKKYFASEIKDTLKTKADSENDVLGIFQPDSPADGKNRQEDWAAKEIRRDIEKNGHQVVSIS